MGKCLVTKLNAVVDNDNLENFNGVIKVRSIENPDYQTQGIRVNGGLRIWTKDGSAMISKSMDFSNPVSEIVTETDTSLYFKNGNYDVFFNKYKISILDTNDGIHNKEKGFSINAQDFKMCNDGKGCTFVRVVPTIIGDISNALGIETTQMYLEGDIELDYNNMLTKDISNLVSCNINDNKKAEIDIDVFSKCVKLTSIHVAGSTKIKGNVDNLAQSMYNNGRRSGTLRVVSNGIVGDNLGVVGNYSALTATFNNDGFTVSRVS